MRFMVIVKADKRTEAGVLPTQAELAEMGKFNEELVKAGVMVDGAGLKPSSKGARLSFPGGKPPAVTDGPFAETKELICGYWIVNGKSLQEVVDRMKKVPFHVLPNDDRTPELEIRPFYEAEDFPAAFEG
ncbi:MAG TPA: YciI family protein [Vicinamibacterales bacterium]|jgi:hypothetical protein|nr:YciI family protein [Vicinamibacterales bacterium]